MAVDGFALFALFAAIAALIAFVMLLLRAWSKLSGDPEGRKRDKIGGGQE